MIWSSGTRPGRTPSWTIVWFPSTSAPLPPTRPCCTPADSSPPRTTRRCRDALTALAQSHERGEWRVGPEDEDVHTAIENRLVAVTGEAGRRIHLGRSRNDQVLAALRLWLKDELDGLSLEARSARRRTGCRRGALRRPSHARLHAHAARHAVDAWGSGRAPSPRRSATTRRGCAPPSAGRTRTRWARRRATVCPCSSSTGRSPRARWASPAPTSPSPRCSSPAARPRPQRSSRRPCSPRTWVGWPPTCASSPPPNSAS